MKKFSKLIQEKAIEYRKMDLFTNPVDWEEIFKPLIEHIEGNLKSNTNGPSNGLFSERTKQALDELIDSVEEDYSDCFKYEIHDGSQKSFLQAFKIDVDYKDIIDCIQPLLDRTGEVDDYGDFDFGALLIKLSNIKFNNLEDLIEDIEDIHLKMLMLKVNFRIDIDLISKTIKIEDSDKNISDMISRNWIDSWGKKSDNIELFNSVENSGITIYIYNKDTVKAFDL